MITLTYKVEPKFEELGIKAFNIWESALSPYYEFEHASMIVVPDIVIKSGTIDLVKYPGRVAQCDKLKNKTYLITMGSHVKWNISLFARFFGSGEDALNCLVHEIGHVFNLPHASEKDFIMHPDIPKGVRLPMITKKEKEAYKAFILANKI